MPAIRVKLRDQELKYVPLNKEETRIGRDPECEIPIDNVGISRVHAIIRFRNNQAWILDNKSSNGTYVDGKAVIERMLSDGDEIQIGKYLLIYDFTGGGEIPVAPKKSFAPVPVPAPSTAVESTVEMYAGDMAKFIKTDNKPTDNKNIVRLLSAVVILLALALAWALFR